MEQAFVSNSVKCRTHNSTSQPWHVCHTGACSCPVSTTPAACTGQCRFYLANKWPTDRLTKRNLIKCRHMQTQALGGPETSRSRAASATPTSAGSCSIVTHSPPLPLFLHILPCLLLLSSESDQVTLVPGFNDSSAIHAKVPSIQIPLSTIMCPGRSHGDNGNFPCTRPGKPWCRGARGLRDAHSCQKSC